jgi:ligand-binding sensor domain-containing protein
MAGHSQGLFRFSNVRKIYSSKILGNSSVPVGSITAIEEDNSGKMYFGIYDNFSIYDKKKRSLKTFHNNPDDQRSISNSSVLSIFMDKGGILWLGTNGYGINRINPSKNIIIYTRIKKVNPGKERKNFCEMPMEIFG